MSVDAQLENEKPFALSFFPLGKGERVKPLLTVDNKFIMLSALYKDENGNTLFRLYNSPDKEQKANVTVEKYSIDKTVEFGRFEIKTFIIEDGKIYQTNLKQKGREIV